MSKRNTLSHEDKIVIIKALLAAGISISQMAKALHCPPKQIKQLIDKHDLLPKFEQLQLFE